MYLINLLIENQKHRDCRSFSGSRTTGSGYVSITFPVSMSEHLIWNDIRATRFMLAYSLKFTMSGKV